MEGSVDRQASEAQQFSAPETLACQHALGLRALVIGESQRFVAPAHCPLACCKDVRRLESCSLMTPPIWAGGGRYDTRVRDTRSLSHSGSPRRCLQASSLSLAATCRSIIITSSQS